MRPSRTASALLSLSAAATLLTGCANQQIAAEDRPVWISVERGYEALEARDYQRARTFFRDAVDKYPGEPKARMGLALSLLELDQPAAARENMEMVYATDPADPEVIDLLAQTMVASGDAPAVIALLQPATLESTDWRDWHRYGKYLAQAGDADTGEQALLTAARLSRGRAIEPHLDLGNLYLAAGDADAALDRYRNALWVDFRDQRVKDAIRSLGHIPGPSFELIPPEASLPADPTGAENQSNA